MCRMHKAKYAEPVEYADISAVSVSEWHLSGMREHVRNLHRVVDCLSGWFICAGCCQFTYMLILTNIVYLIY